MSHLSPENNHNSLALADEIFALGRPPAPGDRFADAVDTFAAGVISVALAVGSLLVGGKIMKDQLTQDWELFKTTIGSGQEYK